MEVSVKKNMATAVAVFLYLLSVNIRIIAKGWRIILWVLCGNPVLSEWSNPISSKGFIIDLTG